MCCVCRSQRQIFVVKYYLETNKSQTTISTKQYVKEWQSLTSCNAPMLCAMQLSSSRSFTFFSRILIFSSGLQRHKQINKM